MFSSSTNYSKLKTNLRLGVNRLKLLEKKKSELAQKARKEIADYITDGKYERAKIRVEHIIREDYMVEAMEIIEMFCDLLLSRFGLLQEMKELDPSLAESVSSLLWVAPRIGSEVAELKLISDQLTVKCGKKYAEACRSGQVETISEKLKHKLSVQAPPKILVEKYLIEIAKIYNISYEPDPQVMREHEQAKGMEALLFDNLSNNLDGEGGASGVRPTGFIGFPQPPQMPTDFQPFNYPSVPPSNPGNPRGGNGGGGSTAPPAALSYNIPPAPFEFTPYDVTKAINTYNAPPPSVPSTTNFPTDNNQQVNEQPKPMPRSKLAPDLPDIPDLPSVPNENPLPDANGAASDDLDNEFDLIAKKFEELQKRK